MSDCIQHSSPYLPVAMPVAMIAAAVLTVLIRLAISRLATGRWEL